MTGKASAIYERLRQYREPYLRRFRDAARYTIPALIPESERRYRRGADLPEPNQSLGASLVSSLASKMTLSLIPLNQKFLRLAVSEDALAEFEAEAQARGLGPEDENNPRLQVEQNLALIEDMIIDKVESTQLRPKIASGMEHLVAGGNVLLHVPGNSLKPRYFPLDRYCVDRTARGDVKTIVICEGADPHTLPASMRSRLQHANAGYTMENGFDDLIMVYTVIERVPDGNGGFTWNEWQEVGDKQLSVPTVHPFERNPYLALRMHSVDGESYGRGHVERNMGDLRAYDGLSLALEQGAAAAAKILMLVNPDGMARIHQLRKAKNGDFVRGREGDITALQLNKFADFSVAREYRAELKMDLQRAFMAFASSVRDAERVTAEEIQFMARELDDTLGGVYGQMSSELQLPLAKILMGNMQDAGELPPLDEEVQPVIVTGLDAIGRGHDLQRLREFVRQLQEAFGPEGVERFLHGEVLARQIAIAQGMDEPELIKTRKEIEAQLQAQQQAELARQMGPKLVDKIPAESLGEAAQDAFGAGVEAA